MAWKSNIHLQICKPENSCIISVYVLHSEYTLWVLWIPPVRLLMVYTWVVSLEWFTPEWFAVRSWHHLITGTDLFIILNCELREGSDWHFIFEFQLELKICGVMLHLFYWISIDWNMVWWETGIVVSLLMLLLIWLAYLIWFEHSSGSRLIWDIGYFQQCCWSYVLEATDLYVTWSSVSGLVLLISMWHDRLFWFGSTIVDVFNWTSVITG